LVLFTLASGDKYDGEWKDDKMNGPDCAPPVRCCASRALPNHKRITPASFKLRNDESASRPGRLVFVCSSVTRLGVVGFHRGACWFNKEQEHDYRHDSAISSIKTVT
jgi:hypothetical protein